MYKATKIVHTEFGSYNKGDLVTDAVGEKYAAFEKVEESATPAPKVKKKAAGKKKVEKVEEVLTEDSSEVEVESTEE